VVASGQASHQHGRATATDCLKRSTSENRPAEKYRDTARTDRKNDRFLPCRRLLCDAENATDCYIRNETYLSCKDVMSTWSYGMPLEESVFFRVKKFFFCMFVLYRCLYVSLYLCFSICPFVRLSVGRSVRPSLCLRACLSLCLSICLCDCLSVFACVYLSVCLSLCLSFSICLFVCPSVCLSI